MTYVRTYVGSGRYNVMRSSRPFIVLKKAAREGLGTRLQGSHMCSTQSCSYSFMTAVTTEKATQLPPTLDSSKDMSMVCLGCGVLLPLPFCLGEEEILHSLLEMGGEGHRQRDHIEFQVLRHWDACNCGVPESREYLCDITVCISVQTPPTGILHLWLP